MGNIKEQKVNSISYLSVSNRKIIEALEGKSDKQLSELGVSEGVLFMIRMGYGNQLREDVYEILSRVLNIDISENPPKNYEV